MAAAASSSGWDPGNQSSENGTVPQWMYSRKFGQLNILQLEADDRAELNPFLVGKCLEACVGEIEGATTEDDGKRFVLRVRNPDQVRKLLALKELKKGVGHPSVAVSVMLHPTLNKRRCVITCREIVKMSEAELVEELRSQGVVVAKRFTGMVDGKKQNLPTVALTIEGTMIPDVIKVGPLRIRTRVYVPEPTICFTCYKYGHTKNRCKAAARCRNCSEVHDLKEECKKKPYCLNCKGEHGPSSRKCPIYLAEKEITRIRVTKGVDYKEAVKQFNAGGGSYAEVSKVQQRLKISENNAVASLIKEKDEVIKKLMDTVAKLTSRVEELEQKKKHKKQKKQQKKKMVNEETDPDQDMEGDMDTDSSLQTAELDKVSDTSSKVNVSTVSSSKITHKRHPTTEIIPPIVKKISDLAVEVDSFSYPDYSFPAEPSFKLPNHGLPTQPNR